MSVSNGNFVFLHDPIRRVMTLEDETVDQKSFVAHSRVKVRRLASSACKNSNKFN